MARRLMREEGLMCGSTSGSAMWAAIQTIKKNKIGEGKRCVVLCPDSVRNFMTKLINDDWMYEQGYISEMECANSFKSDLMPDTDWGQSLTVKDLNLNGAVFLKANTPIGEVIERF